MTDLIRLSAGNSVLLVIDIQDKLLAKIPTAADLIRNTAFLLDAAALLEIPVRITEQYPKGLGPTTDSLRNRIAIEPVAKTAFSCCGAPGFLNDLQQLGRSQVVLTGMETHVCVLQTALDLLQVGFQVFLASDALASRSEYDASLAVRRLERVGAIVTSVESVVFEWVGDSTHPKFKDISKLVVARSSNA